MRPSLADDPYGVALIGEALGEDEAEAGAPFVGKAGFRLSRLIEWAGLDRRRFDVYNAVWCRPPFNKLEGLPFEAPAISHCRANHWGSLLPRSKVLVPLGNVATGALIGTKGILNVRGYVEGREGHYIVPTVHPSFIQRGMSKWSAPFIHDIQKAVRLAAEGMPPQVVSYVLDPSPMEAYRWAQAYLDALRLAPTTHHLPLAFDIETPGKDEDEDDLDVDSDAPDRTWRIERIGFAYTPLAALSVPWAPEYQAAIHLLLGSAGDKVVWNAGFDVPRVRRDGVSINGTIHDGMVAWHILHSDLPKRLGFVATFTCPWQPRWKHLSGARPAFYNATDADVELRSWLVIKEELQRVGLWDVYQRDVVDLEPILRHMHEKGMPIDAEVRQDRARRLSDAIRTVRSAMEAAVPEAARRIEHVFAGVPRDTTGLLRRPGHREVPVCARCGLEKPRKDHFKTFVKKANPCAGAQAERRRVEVEEYYRLAEFTPSRDQLIRYHAHLGRSLPQVWDKKQGKKKVSFGERQLKDLTIRYPSDTLYPSILKFRELDKVAGTYIGRLTDAL